MLQPILMLVALLTAAGCGSQGGSSADPVLRLSLQPIPAYAPMWVARKKGWLDEALATAKQGQVEWLVMRDGPLQNEAFGASLLDVAFMGDTPAVIGVAAGLPVRIVSMASISPTSLGIVVRQDSPIRTPADLKGRKIGVTKGSFCHHLLALVLKEAGMSLDDIQFINMSVPEISTSLHTGELDAGATWEPYLSKLVEPGAMRVLKDGTGVKRGDEVIVAAESFTRDRPATFETMLAVYRRGIEFIEQDPKSAAALIAEEMNLEVEPLAAILQKTRFTTGLDEQDLEDFRKTTAFLLDLGVIRRGVEIERLVDSQRLKQETP